MFASLLSQWRPSRVGVGIDGGGKRPCWRDVIERRCRWRWWIGTVVTLTFVLMWHSDGGAMHFRCC